MQVSFYTPWSPKSVGFPIIHCVMIDTSPCPHVRIVGMSFGLFGFTVTITNKFPEGCPHEKN